MNWNKQTIYHFPRVKKLFDKENQNLLPHIRQKIEEKMPAVNVDLDSCTGKYSAKQLSNPMTRLYRRVKNMKRFDESRFRISIHEKLESLVRHRYFEWKLNASEHCLHHINPEGLIAIDANPDYFDLGKEDYRIKFVERAMQMLQVPEISPLMTPSKGHRGFLTFTADHDIMDHHTSKHHNYYEMLVYGNPFSCCFGLSGTSPSRPGMAHTTVRVIATYSHFNTTHICVKTEIKNNFDYVARELSLGNYKCLAKQNGLKGSNLPIQPLRVMGEGPHSVNSSDSYVSVTPPWLKSLYGPCRVPFLYKLRSVSYPKDRDSGLLTTRHLTPDEDLLLVLEHIKDHDDNCDLYLDLFPPHKNRSSKSRPDGKNLSANLKELLEFASVEQQIPELIDFKILKEFCEKKVRSKKSEIN